MLANTFPKSCLVAAVALLVCMGVGPAAASTDMYALQEEDYVGVNLTGVGLNTSHMYFELPLASDSVLNFFITVEPHLSAPGANDDCSGMHVVTEIRPYKPNLMDPHNTSLSGVSSFDRLIGLTQTSSMCVSKPFSPYNVKSSGNATAYFILIQTLSSGNTTTGSCRVNLYVSALPRPTFYFQVWGWWILQTSIVLSGVLYIVSWTRVEGFRTPNWAFTFVHLALLVPEIICYVCVSGATAGYQRFMQWQHHRQQAAAAKEARARAAQQQRSLITPANARRSDNPEGEEMRPVVAEDGAAVPTAVPISEEEEEDECRICREGAADEELIQPCACAGSLRYIHRSCLDRWRMEATRRNPLYSTQCEICKTDFNYRISRRQRASATGKVFGKQLSQVILSLLVLLGVIVLFNILIRVTIGEATCSAPYHSVYYSLSPFGFTVLLGAVYYMGFMFILYHVMYFAWVVRQLEATTGDEYFTTTTKLRIFLGVIWAFVTMAYVGYSVRMVFFASSQDYSWDWELALATGAITLLLGFVCIAFIVMSIMALKKCMGADGEEVVAQQPLRGRRVRRPDPAALEVVADEAPRADYIDADVQPANRDAQAAPVAAAPPAVPLPVPAAPRNAEDTEDLLQM